MLPLPLTYGNLFHHCIIVMLALFIILHKVSGLPDIHASHRRGRAFLETRQTCCHDAEKSKVDFSFYARNGGCFFLRPLSSTSLLLVISMIIITFIIMVIITVNGRNGHRRGEFSWPATARERLSEEACDLVRLLSIDHCHLARFY